jgi:hypothetical protein
MSTFDEASKILRTIPKEFNEDYLFILIDEMPIKEEEYKQFIEKQQIAIINTKIHEHQLIY